MPRIRAASVREAHDRMGDVACAWRDASIPEDARRYAYRCGTAHLLAAGRPRDAAILAGRCKVYGAARSATPRRWTGNTRNWTPVGDVHLNRGHPELARRESAR